MPNPTHPDVLEEDRNWRDEKRAEVRERAKTDEPLAHLLAILDASADLMREIGCDSDAVVLDSHRAQLVAGREWPGDPITSPFPPELALATLDHKGDADA